MKSPQTEMGHVTEQFTRIAIAFPQVHMVLQNGDRTIYDLPRCERWSERIRIFFGDEVGDALIPIDSHDRDIHLRGYVADPSVSRSNNRMQYLFLNGRCIRDRALQHALSEAYRGLLMVGRFPVCFLRLDMPPGDVDVNVHPTKSEVRFADGGRIYSQLLQALRHKFLSTDLTAKVASKKDETELETGSNVPVESVFPTHRPNDLPGFSTPALSPSMSSGETDIPWPGRLGRVDDFRPFPNIGPSFRNAVPAMQSPAVGQGFARRDPFPPDLMPSSLARNDRFPSPMTEDRWNSAATHSQVDPIATIPDPSSDFNQGLASEEVAHRMDYREAPASSHLGFQIHNRYLVTQDEEGMVVVDQHALHERIMYEQIREKVLSEQLETQKLLVPEPVTLTPAEAAAALQASDMLKKVGITIEPFGEIPF